MRVPISLYFHVTAKPVDFELILKFLQSLARNNNRDWFEKNKPTYLRAKGEFELFLVSFLAELAKFDTSVRSLDPRKLAFRIYRDVRFSKDKRPYKTNMGAGISPAGKLVQDPGYYIHIEPGKSFIAGGMYMPDPSNLAKIRQEIDYNATKLNKILKAASFQKLYPSLDDFDKLKTAPKGYPKDHPQIELLKHKSFIVSHSFSDRDVKSKAFVKQVAASARVLKPLNDFLKEAIA